MPATPDTSRPAGVSSSALLLPLIEETDILVEKMHAVKRRRLSTTTGETIYIIQVTVSPAGSNMHLLAYLCLIMVLSRVAYDEYLHHRKITLMVVVR